MSAAREQSNVPATILLTAHGNEELVVRAFKSGVHEYLSKLKLKSAHLKEAVNAALAAHEREISRSSSTAYALSSLHKPFFYRRLTSAVDQKTADTLAALFLVRANDFSQLQAKMGLLEADVLTTLIFDAVSKACEWFHETASVTRLGDGTVAALVGSLKDTMAVRTQADALCRAAAAVRSNGSTTQFTVSVGAVVIAADAPS